MAGRGLARDPWAWPTHHYGRWGFSARRVVLDSRPNVGSGVGVVGVRARLRELVPARLQQQAGLSFGAAIDYGGRHYDPWNAWTVVPHRSFGSGYVNVGINVINVNRIDTRIRQSFTPRDRGPDYTHYAVPRGSGPVRASAVGSPIVGRVHELQPVSHSRERDRESRRIETETRRSGAALAAAAS